MQYTPQNFDHLFGLTGFSEPALTTHLKLYQGYVTNTNRLADQLAQMLADGRTDTPEYAELKRRFGWEFNGMRLHEHHFGTMTKTSQPLDEVSPLGQKIARDFGSVEQWQVDFRATAMMRGIGWVILCYDKPNDRLFNVWVNEHDLGHLAGAALLLNLDVFEHAFMLDYGTNRADYVSAFLGAIDWSVVSDRLASA